MKLVVFPYYCVEVGWLAPLAAGGGGGGGRGANVGGYCLCS